MGRPRSVLAQWCALVLPLLLLGVRCPLPGQTSFVSAERVNGYGGVELSPFLLASDTAGTASRSDRQVVEGDLFRVLSPGLLLNLNSYRGLQVIDIGDAMQPKIKGRLPLAGQPVEAYVVGDVAFVLVNGARLFGRLSYGDGVSETGSRILSVDLSDPAQPVVLDEVELVGWIRTSRLTQEGEHAALYVVADEWSFSDISLQGSSHTLVTSFDVADGLLTPIERLDLGGYVTAVQATPELLMVARQPGWSVDGGTRVALVDIRDPFGGMVLGDELAVPGFVYSQFNMDFYRGIVRVVSGSRWGTGNINTLQTFDASDLSDVVAVDTAAFGANESLFATLFLGNRAFFVTYLRIDPFHAFEISDEGLITPHVEFEVSGWNDFFRAVVDDSRLIGIGIDDQAGRTLAVSLYDVSELSNPEPLLARERVAADYAFSEANYDHRAFSVLEDAVSVLAPNGVEETGLILLPYTGWDSASSRWLADVQLFTFSADTLTRRGSMSHGSPVRRSFATDEDQVANLSEEKLSLFETADPDQPVPLGSLDLAPNYTDVLRFGDYRVRLVDASNGPFPWYPGEQAPPAAVEVIPADADPDLAEAVARFEIAPGAVVHRTGSLLVSIASDANAWVPETGPETEITVYDLSDPTHPLETGRLRSHRLQPSYGYWYRGDLPFRSGLLIADCYGCFAPYTNATNSSAAVPGGLAFLQAHPDRAWALDVLDLSDPTAPRFAESVALGAGVQGLSLLADGSDAWIATKRFLGLKKWGRPSAQYFALRVDVSVPSAPAPDAPINVPGELMAVDGTRIFTRDLQWDGDALETALVRLALDPPVARVEAVRWFAGRSIEKVALDGVGHALVLHGPAQWGGYILWRGDFPVETHALSILDAHADDLAVLSESPLEAWSSLLDVIPGRALLRTSGGLLVFDLEDASAPYPRAFYPSRSGIERVRIEDRNALSAGGRYGIQLFDLDATNLRSSSKASSPTPCSANAAAASRSCEEPRRIRRQR